MSLLSRLASLNRNLFARPRLERDLDDELRAYLDQLTEEKRASGLGAATVHQGGLAPGWFEVLHRADTVPTDMESSDV